MASVLAVGCVAALAPVAVGLDAVGAVVGFAVDAAEPTNSTVTTSTRHVTTTKRVDLAEVPPPECEFPGAPSTKVDETSTALDQVVVLRDTIGPGEIMTGPDESVLTIVPAGTVNLDVLQIFETVVTQSFQATAAGEACVVVAAVRFTG